MDLKDLIKQEIKKQLKEFAPVVIAAKSGGILSGLFDDDEDPSDEHSEMSEGVPFPQDSPNEFAYLDFKKWVYKNRGPIKKDLKKYHDTKINFSNEHNVRFII